MEHLLRGGLLPGAVSHGQRRGSLPQHAEHVHLPQLGHVKQDPLGLATGIDVGSKASAVRNLPREFRDGREARCDRRVANPVEFGLGRHARARTGDCHQVRDQFLRACRHPLVVGYAKPAAQHLIGGDDGVGRSVIQRSLGAYGHDLAAACSDHPKRRRDIESSSNRRTLRGDIPAQCWKPVSCCLDKPVSPYGRQQLGDEGFVLAQLSWCVGQHD